LRKKTEREREEEEGKKGREDLRGENKKT